MKMYRVKPQYGPNPLTGEPGLDYAVQKRVGLFRWETLRVYDRERTAEADVALLERDPSREGEIRRGGNS